MVETVKSSRLLSLDIIRGITIAGMILVNNPGSWGHIYAPLRHAEWDGLTPTDLVFPFFMFIMGAATYFSLKKFDFRLTTKSFIKILRRSIVLFLIGWAIQWFSHFCYTLSGGGSIAEAVNNLESLHTRRASALGYLLLRHSHHSQHSEHKAHTMDSGSAACGVFADAAIGSRL